MGDLHIAVADGVATLTITRPEANNSIGGDLLREYLAATRMAEADDDVRAVITASCGGAWCPGADFEHISHFGPGTDADHLFWDQMMHGDHAALGISRQGRRHDGLGPGRWIEAVLELQKPMIAAVEGAVAGGGLGLLGLHDYRVASRAAKFRAAFPAVGVGPDMGASWFLPRLVGHSAATEMLLLNRVVSAEEAYEMGLVHQVVDEGNALAAAAAVAAEIATFPPLGVRATIRALRASASNTLRQQLELEWDNQRITMASDDARRAIETVLKGKAAALVDG